MADARWLHSEKTAVSVNQRALVEKILARYAVDFFLLKELIQNADDAGASEVIVDLVADKHENMAPALRAQLAGPPTFTALSVTNRGGQLFDEGGWDRVIEIATGNPDENSVGHFGVGFFSVFAASERPRIHSGRRVMDFFWEQNEIRVKLRLLRRLVSGRATCLLRAMRRGLGVQALLRSKHIRARLQKSSRHRAVWPRPGRDERHCLRGPRRSGSASL